MESCWCCADFLTAGAELGDERGKARFLPREVEGAHAETAGLAQHAVEGGAGGVVAEDGEGGADGVNGKEEKAAFEEESVDAEVAVELVVPETDSPIDGGSDAIKGEDAPGIEHTDAEGAGMVGVEGMGVCFGTTEEDVEAAGLGVEEGLEVGEVGAFVECGSEAVTTLLSTLRFA